MAFDTGMAPAVGRQITIAEKIGDEDRHLIELLMKRAIIGDCDLVARGLGGKTTTGVVVSQRCLSRRSKRRTHSATGRIALAYSEQHGSGHIHLRATRRRFA